MTKLAQTSTCTVDAQIEQLEQLIAVRRLTFADRRQPDLRRELGRKMARRNGDLR